VSVDESLSGLLPLLLDGAFEEPLWTRFLEALRVRTGANYASLIFRPPAPSRPTLVHLYAGEQSPPDVRDLYRETLHLRDPLPYHTLEDGRVYASEALLDAGDPEHQAFRRDVLVPSGLNITRMMRVVEPSGVNVWLLISRAEGDFEAEHSALLGSLAPFLRTSLRGYVALERARLNAAVAGEAIRRLNFGWLSLDTGGHVLDSDAQGAKLLAESSILRQGQGGRLIGGSPALDREIAHAVKSLAGDPRGRPRAVILSRDPWVDMLLVPVHRKSIATALEPAMIAYVHGDSWSAADRCDQIAELFELLPSEARLALALSRGMTIAEAAVELGLTIETARNYSKKIYAKMGARGQPDLVRFIHRSVLAIA
jgi:DNA-binding CsgD family transcriptional regulator